MTIENVMPEDLARIVAGLTREGLTFRATQNQNKAWTITLTGGF